MVEKTEDEVAKSEYLAFQNFYEIDENFQLEDLTEMQKFILCCVRTKDIYKSPSDLAKEVAQKHCNMDESD